MPDPKATLLLTRPKAASVRFARRFAGLPMRIVIAPLVDIGPLEVRLPPDRDASFLFTSEQGARRAAELGARPGARAFCVGDRTAQVAKQMGFDAVSADGDAEDVLALVVRARPAETIFHVCGQQTRGNLVKRIRAAGLRADAIVAYAQAELALGPNGQAALSGADPVLAPVFSPQSAVRLAAHLDQATAPVTVLAISDATAQTMDSARCAEVIVADRPTADAMDACIKGWLARLPVA